MPISGIKYINHLPFMPQWKWLHTPGHTKGHVSFFRESDGVIIAGDAFTTLKQESLLSVLTQRETISGPPKYFTIDWKAAEDSVRVLRDLNPSLAVPSHGKPMKGQELTNHLQFLTSHFQEIAVPDQGLYV